MRTLLPFLLALLLAPAARAGSEIAVTFDDLPVVTSGDALARQQRITRDLIRHLRTRRIPAIGFVNANKVMVDGAADPARVALLQAWLDGGFDLGNHTFAHLDLHRISAEDFESMRLFERPIRQVLLVHANALNAEAFGALADRLMRNGHRFIALDRALEDPAYRGEDEWYGAGGISWMDRWALARGVDRKTFFAGEPRTAPWVLTLTGLAE